MNQKKSILHVVNIFFVLPYFIGDQFNYLYKKGYDVHVICSPSKHISGYSKKQNFKYKEIPILRSFSIIQDLISVIEIFKYIKINNIETVVGHTPKAALLSMLAARMAKTPKRIYFRHGLMYETSTGFKRWLLIQMEKLTSLFSTKIVCVSPSIYKKSLTDKLNNEQKQIILGKGTCGGIDSLLKFNPDKITNDKLENLRDSLNINSTDIVIGYCGRLVKDKGIIELVNAYNRISPINDFKLLLVGGYEERDALPQTVIESIESNKNIIVTGFLYNDIEYYYSLMSIFVLPSYREGFPTVILEASSMKIPVLTTRVTGCVDSIVEGETGFYVSNSAESIYEGIEMLRNSDDLKILGENGRNFVVENFDHRILWQIIEKELYL